jgi:simple sugar transport system ATP-binding protein
MLELQSLVLRSEAAHRPSIDLDVRRGEILGIAGVAGNGQTELAETISGTRQPESGEILLESGSITGLRAGGVAARGVGYVPEDRNRTATTPGLTVAEALTLKGLHTPEVRRHALLRRGVMAERAREAIAAFDIKPPHPQVQCGQLSGGNLQKVVLARELAVARRLLVAVQPTQGLDIAARDFVHERLRDRVANGMSLILVSTDLDELLALSHRIAVIYRFGVIGIVDAEEATTVKVGRLMGGVTDD